MHRVQVVPAAVHLTIIFTLGHGVCNIHGVFCFCLFELMQDCSFTITEIRRRLRAHRDINTEKETEKINFNWDTTARLLTFFFSSLLRSKRRRSALLGQQVPCRGRQVGSRELVLQRQCYAGGYCTGHNCSLRKWPSFWHFDNDLMKHSLSFYTRVPQ